MNNPMLEMCKHCGCTFGSHHGGSYPWPYNYCPGHEGRMDWDKGPGTVFGSTGIFKEDKKESEEANTTKSFHNSFDKCIEEKWSSGMVQGMGDDTDIMV